MIVDVDGNYLDGYLDELVEYCYPTWVNFEFASFCKGTGAGSCFSGECTTDLVKPLPMSSTLKARV